MENVVSSNDRVRGRAVDKVLIGKLFDKLSAVYGYAWSSRHKSAESWDVTITTWLDALKDFDYLTIRDALHDALSLYTDFPPTLAQLVKLCHKFCGIPSCDACVCKAVKREFDHPVILMVYQAVGSFVFKTAKANDLADSAKKIYEDILTSYLQNPVEHQRSLDEYIAKDHESSLKIAKDSSKDLGAMDIKRLVQWVKSPSPEQLMKANELAKLEHPVWDPCQYNSLSKKYDHSVYESRRTYLTKLSDDKAMTLSKHDSYDRIRYLSQLEAMETISAHGSHYPTGYVSKSPIKAFKSSIKNIKDYMPKPYKD